MTLNEDIISNCLNKFVLFSKVEDKIFCFTKKSKGFVPLIYVFETENVANEAKNFLMLNNKTFENFYVKTVVNSNFLSKKQKAKCIVFYTFEDFKMWMS